MKKSLLADLPTQGNPRWDESIGFRSMHTGSIELDFDIAP
jgi:hypothetical protein